MEEREAEPKVGEAGVPLWIKIMWTAGIIWIIYYIYTWFPRG